VNVLVAEDQPPSALIIQRMLERMGHEVQVVPDGEEAWSVLLDREIPLLISDWMMPHLDGLALCRRLRASPRPRYTYVLLVTSCNRRSDRLEGLRAGADNFLAKPWDAQELAVHLEIACRILAVHDELARQNQRLAELASVDGLTGLKNRRVLFEELDRAASLAGRGCPPYSIILLDVDHFKRYNDTFGHLSGDDVLRTVSRTLRATVRDVDLVARYGGEEFVALLESTDRETATQVAERIRSAIAETEWLGRPVTVSLGVASADPPSPAAVRELIGQADQALYRAKNSGRNQARHYLDDVRPPAH
jgi:diguanylate cyclase (GGDEF)-like protein